MVYSSQLTEKITFRLVLVGRESLTEYISSGARLVVNLIVFYSPPKVFNVLSLKNL